MRKILNMTPICAVLLIVAACSRQPPFKPVGSVKQIMAAAIVPSSEVLFDAVGTIVSAKGVEEIAPKNDEEWTNVRNHAILLAESGNLLMLGGRAKDNGEWMKIAQALVDAGVVALKAAEAKNPAALFDAGAGVYEVCERCHSRYWKEGRDNP